MRTHTEKLLQKFDEAKKPKKRSRPVGSYKYVKPAVIPQPVKLPEVKVERAVYNPFGNLEELNLEGGSNLDVGDVFFQIRKFVIKEIKKTAGSSTVTVKAEVTKRSWQHNQPMY